MVTCHFSSKERTKVVIVNRAFVREKSESFGRSGHLQHIIQLYNRYRDIFTYNLDHNLLHRWDRSIGQALTEMLIPCPYGREVKVISVPGGVETEFGGLVLVQQMCSLSIMKTSSVS